MADVSLWDALGNRYVVAEGVELAQGSVRERVGDADGIVEVLSVDGPTADVRIWNPDGSTAELSGNGTRIAARWLAERTGSHEVRIRVGDRVVLARMLDDGLVETDVGPVRVHPRERVAGLEVTAVDVGNPHAVVEGDPDDVLLVGPLLETHPRYPRRTNVEVVRVDGPGRLTARVWERGVGETTASGTGAVAAAAATHGDGEIAVRFPGGELQVRLAEGRATLTGPAVEVRSDAG
jgi:diaminopimelate epimerase